jgi:hypothetical protein
MRLIPTCATILSLTVAGTIGIASALAETSSPPPGGTPTGTDKAAISKACSQQADAQNLHGKARKQFRAACKKRGGAPA